MCMKNLNATIISADILGNENTKKISLGNIDKAYYYRTENGVRKIKDLFSFVLLMQGIQGKKKDDKNSNTDPNKFYFSKKYAIKIRLTESNSGKAIDLDEFEIYPKETAIDKAKCCNIFNCTRLCVYKDIVLPHKDDEEFFVIKVLIKNLNNNSKKEEDWKVQTVYPVSFISGDI